MPKRRQTVNDVTARSFNRILYCGHSTQQSHPVVVVVVVDDYDDDADNNDD